MIRIMKSRKFTWMISTGFVIVFLEISTAFGQVGTEMMPKIVEKNGRHALLVDGQPFFMLGGQAHNSSGWPGMLPRYGLLLKH